MKNEIWRKVCFFRLGTAEALIIKSGIFIWKWISVQSSTLCVFFMVRFGPWNPTNFLFGKNSKHFMMGIPHLLRYARWKKNNMKFISNYVWKNVNFYSTVNDITLFWRNTQLITFITTFFQISVLQQFWNPRFCQKNTL